MRAHDLIRTHEGAEAPAPGCWRIPNSHVTVQYSARIGIIRRVRGRTPSASGALWVPDDLDWGVELELDIGAWAHPYAADVPSLGTLLGPEPVGQVSLRAPRMRPTIDGAWRCLGEIWVRRVSTPVPVTVIYHGVYLAGDDAKTWLTARASIACRYGARHRWEPLELAADVLAVAPHRLRAGAATTSVC